MDLPELIHLEQNVNERLGDNPRANIASDLLPEANLWRPLAWVRVPREEVLVLHDVSSELADILAALDGGGGTILFPVHPLVALKLSPTSVVHRGRIAVSASYRTVFFEPDPECPLQSLITTGQMMIKLHLDDPLPGIAGDRRLTREKVTKCIELSGLLPKLLHARDTEHAPLHILRERFGLVHEGRGAIIRLVPRRGLVPIFALYSRDRTEQQGRPMIVSLVERLGWSARDTARNLAGWLAEPILKAVFAGFRQGFALELHGQNTLISLKPSLEVDQVYFRDLESVVYFPELRERHGLAPLDLQHLGPELYQEPRNPTRWFNRNVDQDVGGTFYWTLRVLEREGIFSGHEVRVATRYIKETSRRLIADFGLERTARQGRWLPFSRSPYGTGRKRGDYYRTRFR